MNRQQRRARAAQDRHDGVAIAGKVAAALDEARQVREKPSTVVQESGAQRKAGARKGSGKVITRIPAEVWDRVREVPGLQAKILDVAETEGAEGVARLLKPYGM